MSESTIMRRILLALSQLKSTRMFRNNVGLAYAGKARKQGRQIIITDGYPIKFGLFKGSSDLIGWTEVDGYAVFTSIEVKDDETRVRPEQVTWIENVKHAGGIAGIARTEQEAQDIINDYRRTKEAGQRQAQSRKPYRQFHYPEEAGQEPPWAVSFSCGKDTLLLG